MKNKLTEIHKKAFEHLLENKQEFSHENYADYLFANAVIALPCKVGDIGFAFSTELKEVVPYCVDEIHIDEFVITFEGYVDNENGDEIDRGTFTGAEVGKVIFFGDNAEAEAQAAHATRMKGAPEWMTKE